MGQSEFLRLRKRALVHSSSSFAKNLKEQGFYITESKGRISGYALGTVTSYKLIRLLITVMKAAEETYPNEHHEEIVPL